MLFTCGFSLSGIFQHDNMLVNYSSNIILTDEDARATRNPCVRVRENFLFGHSPLPNLQGFLIGFLRDFKFSHLAIVNSRVFKFKLVKILRLRIFTFDHLSQDLKIFSFTDLYTNINYFQLYRLIRIDVNVKSSAILIFL